MDSMEFHGIHGIPWNPWISMESMEFHGFHGMQSTVQSTVQYCIYIYGALWGPRVPIYGALWGPQVRGLMDPKPKVLGPLVPEPKVPGLWDPKGPDSRIAAPAIYISGPDSTVQ